MAQSALIKAYEIFMETAQPFLIITNEDEHAAALEAVELALESAEDTQDDTMEPLIAMLSHAIERYESQDERLSAFVAEAEAIPMEIAVLKVLMDQYKLTGCDLPEIGGKAMVSKVMSGQRVLSRKAIEALSAAFVDADSRHNNMHMRMIIELSCMRMQYSGHA